MDTKNIGRSLLLSFFLQGMIPALCFANPDQAKIYKSVFGGDKPKCISCHVDKIPKKEAGKHDLNEYGQKVKAAKTGEKPDEETYKTVGKNENAE